MRFEVHFKTPDAVEYATSSAVEYMEPETDEERQELEEYDGDLDPWRKQQANKLEEFMKKWVRYGEAVTVEFDTEAGTAVVKST